MLPENSYNRNDVWPIVYHKFFLPFQKNFPEIKCNIVGSIRRQKKTVHDFDILIVSTNLRVIEWCAWKINSEGLIGSFNQIKGEIEGIKTQIWFCEPREYGPHLLMRTGPLDFNLRLATIAKKMGLTLSEHGLFRGTPENRGERIDENTEANIIWILLGCKWIHPKDRERERKYPQATMCIICNQYFIKGDRIMLNNENQWIHEYHLNVLSPNKGERKPNDPTG